MSILGLVLWWALQIYFFALIGRFIGDLVMSVNRGWRPKGILLPILDIAYSLTDPPLKFLRRFIPPLRLGGFSLDFAWTLLLFAVLIGQRLVVAL
jgi:YggT family protein